MRSSSSSEPLENEDEVLGDEYPENDDSTRRETGQSDRRERPTKMFSRYTIVGKRRKNRRDSDPNRRYYIDWVSGPYLTLLIAVAAFIIIDAFSTLHIISQGGGEANPIMDWMIKKGVGWFIFAKFCTAVVGFMILAVHRFFPIARPLVGVLLAAYGGIVMYHIYLLIQIHL